MRGVIERINYTYGFVRDEHGVPRFFIPSMLAKGVPFTTLREGQAVTFDPITRPRGEAAINVAPVPTTGVDLEDA